VAVAAAVVVGVFGTVTVLSNLPGAGNKNSATSAEAPQSRNGQGGSQLAGPPDVTAPQLLASGTNYNPGAFGKLSSGDTAIAPLAPGGSSRSANEAVPGPGGGPAISGPIPNELRRLTGATGRDACLAAILAEYGGTVTLVDYARFEGRPALVVLLDGAKGRSTPWVVVVGPSCGTGGAIADELFNGPAR
jgi:hypothetical protein